MFCLRWEQRSREKKKPGQIRHNYGAAVIAIGTNFGFAVCRNVTAGREAIEHRKHFPICILNLSMVRCADRARRSESQRKKHFDLIRRCMERLAVCNFVFNKVR